MDNIIALGFDFSMAKLATPACIIGIILLVMSVVLIAASSKIDEAIQRKMKAKRKAEIPVEKEENKEEDAKTEDVESDEGSETQYKKATAIDNNIVNDDGEISMWRHKNGSINYFYVFKIVGLVLVIVSAIMIVVGMK